MTGSFITLGLWYSGSFMDKIIVDGQLSVLFHIFRKKLFAFEYKVEDETSLLGTSIALELRITKRHIQNNNKVSKDSF